MLGILLVLPLMFIIIAGNLLRRFGFYQAADIKTLTRTLYWVILPPLMTRTIFLSGREVLTQPNLLIGLTVSYIVTIAIAWSGASFVFHRGDRGRIAVSAFASMRSNNVYLGFPVMFLAAGNAGLHNSSTYLAVCMISFQFLSIGVAEIITSGRITLATLGGILRKLAINPLILSSALGLALALAGLEKLPGPIDQALELMGNAATAVALIALGGTLDLAKFSSLARILRNTWADCIMKLVIHPATMWFMLTILPVPRPLLQATVMLSSMPSAVNCFILAQEMKMDGEYAADLVASTTILGAISIPLWASLLGLV